MPVLINRIFTLINLNFLIIIIVLFHNKVQNSKMSKRKDHWEQIYQDKSPLEVSWYQSEPSLSLKLIENCSLKEDDSVIDVGGGASLLVDRLCEKGYKNLSVLDISANALKHAKGRLANQHCAVEWVTADITAFSSPQQFSLWHDRAVFHFLTDASDRKKYIDNLSASLKSGGYLILAAFSFDGPDMCSGLTIVQYDREKLTKEIGNQFKFVNEENETHITPAGSNQIFTYYRFQKK